MLLFFYLFMLFKLNFNLNMYLCFIIFIFRVRYVWNDFIDYWKKKILFMYMYLIVVSFGVVKEEKKILWILIGILGKWCLMI